MLGLGNTIQSSVDSRKSVWNPDDDVTENLLGLKIWLTARDEDLELAGTRVVSWSDRANNITFSQNTAAKRPLWTAANQEITFLVTSTADYLQGDTATVLDTSSPLPSFAIGILDVNTALIFSTILSVILD